MDGVNQLIPFRSQKKGHRQNETHQEELDWIKHPSSRIHLLKHTLKPQPKNMNRTMVGKSRTDSSTE